jgi:hypothetical protein
MAPLLEWAATLEAERDAANVRAEAAEAEVARLREALMNQWEIRQARINALVPAADEVTP